MSKVIPIRCKGNRYLSFTEIKAFQGNLKEMSKENFLKLRNLILKHGWIAPVFVWNEDKILDGHGRLLVLGELIKEGYSIDKIPVVDIEAETKKEAAEILLAINSHFQSITDQGLYEFMATMEIDLSELQDFVLPDINLEKFELSYFKEGLTDDDEVPPVSKKTKSKLGDLYLLGEHRILCGDATKKEDIERLMNGKKADMVFTDPPYGVTACQWDTIIPFNKIWEMLLSIMEDNSAIVITASQPFTSALVMSNIKMFKYEWIWEKDRGTNFLQAKYMPMKIHENVLVFYGKTPIFNQQRYIPKNLNTLCRSKRRISNIKRMQDGQYLLKGKANPNNNEFKMPESILYFERETGNNQFAKEKTKHPTQKPVSLIEYLIKTYSNKNNIIPDPFLGSGSTLIAAEKTNRICFGLEIEPLYIDVIIKRWEDFTGKKAIKCKR